MISNEIHRPPPIRTPHVEEEEYQEETQASDMNNVSWYIPSEWKLQALALLNITSSYLINLSSFVFRVGKSIWKSLQPEIFIFFEDSDVPYNKNDLNLSAPGVPPIMWFYDAKLHRFISFHLFDTSHNIHLHHLPYLSVEIKYENLLLHDITDFMEKIRWAGDPGQEPPSPSILLSSWALESGIILKKSDALKLVVIDEEGNEQSLSLRS